MSHTHLFLIRHAEVEARFQKVFGGRMDMDISTRGLEQARMLADYLRHRRLDAAYASPMKRVQQTLVPFLQNGSPKPAILSDLREVDFGDWTGYGWAEVHEKFGTSAYEWLNCLERGSIPNAEPMATYRGRVEPCLKQIVERHRGESVAVFCHGGVIRMMLSLLLDIPFPKTDSFEIAYASVTEVVLLPRRSEVRLLNFTPWRDLLPHDG